MEQDYIVIDNVVSEIHQDIIEKEVTEAGVWKFRSNVCFKQTNTDGDVESVMGFNQIFYDKWNPKAATNPDAYIFRKVITPLAKEIAKKANVNIKELVVARSFALLPLDKKFRKEYDCVHVDMKEPHLVFLYYINDSDGDTVLFDKTTNDIPFDETGVSITKNNLKIIERVTPKRGRVLVFNGNRYHSSSSPTKNARFIINLNIFV